MTYKKVFKSVYESPIGNLILLSDGEFLTGLFFENESVFNYSSNDNLEVFKITKEWLDDYFNGLNPKPDSIPIKQTGTEFQMLVWKELMSIPYGTTTTYGDIATKIAAIKGINKMSSQAVGNAIHNNKVAIIVPCHRVIGKNNRLVGYAAGLDKKKSLLELENIYFHE